MVTRLQVVKKAVNLVVGWSAARVVQTVIQNNYVVETPADHIAVTTGSYVLGAMVGDLSSRYSDAKIEQIADWWRKNVVKNNQTQS